MTSNLDGRIASRQGKTRCGEEDSGGDEAPAPTLARFAHQSPWQAENPVLHVSLESGCCSKRLNKPTNRFISSSVVDFALSSTGVGTTAVGRIIVIAAWGLPIVRRLFGSGQHEDVARRLYAGIVEQARQPSFFAACGLPDTVDGRFDLLVLHVFLVMHRLKRDRSETAELSQALFDVLFQDMDESLRRMGAGDMGVGHRIKAMAEGFYGRVLAYERALEQGEEALQDCVRRNLLGARDGDPGQVQALARYIGREVAALAAQNLAQLAQGRVAFGPAPKPADRG